ncbi:MAG: gamma-glutamyltransferase [Myxococcota bacterium]
MLTSSTEHSENLSGRRSEAASPCGRRAGRIDRANGILCAFLLVSCVVGSTVEASPPEEGQLVVGRYGMVVSSHHDAARAGAAILEQGGNAFDAAVATAFAVGVAQPFSAGVGGGAFVLARSADGSAIALDAREMAPGRATSMMFVSPGVREDASVHGALAVAVPAFVPGMLALLDAHGTMSPEQVLAPAIDLAENGVEIGSYHATMAGFMRARLGSEEFAETWRIQFAPFDPVHMKGERLVQSDLALSLRLLAREGGRLFRDGPIGRAIVREVERRGGILSLQDMTSYEPKWRDPIVSEYRGYRVLSFPPPSSGGAVLAEALNVLDGFDLRSIGADSVSAIHLLAEAMKLAFADRAAFLGDADFVDVPIARLVSREYARSQRARIDTSKATRISGPGAIPEDSGTTHLSVTDSWGNAVALTMTINTPYGSGITVPGTGIILNNEMDDFAVARNTPNSYGLVDTRGANLVAPFKRPLSSMTPTILERDGRLFMVTGSPGGPRIISTTLLTIVNVVDWGMNPARATAAPRFHHQWDPDRIELEPGLDDSVAAGLRKRGHEVVKNPRRWSAAEVIVIDPATGLHLGGADPRTDGAAVGVDRVPGRDGYGLPSKRFGTDSRTMRGGATAY